jgi:hypothetical protein
MENWQKAFEYLEPLEDFYQELDDESKELFETRKLMGDVNYHILKLPSLSDATNNALGCIVCIGPARKVSAWKGGPLINPKTQVKCQGIESLMHSKPMSHYVPVYVFLIITKLK